LTVSDEGSDVSFVEPSMMCIATKPAIQRAPEYTEIGIGIMEGENNYKIKDVGTVTLNGEQICFMVSGSIEACPIMHAPNPEDATEDVTEGKCGLVESIVTEVAMKQGCHMGDRKSCAWLEPGSMSAAAAMGLGLIIVIVAISCCFSSCCGAWLHPKSRAVMLKHLNKAFYDESDKNGDGMLDKGEIRAMLDKEFGKKISDKDLDALFDKFDHDHNGQFDFNEYKEMMAEYKQSGIGGKGNKIHPPPPTI